MPKLVVVAGPDAGREFVLVGPTVGLGRHSANAVHLADQRVSRKHLELRATPGGYRLFDLNSGNGTQVNGRMVQVMDLRPGDRIAAGDTVLEYRADPAAPAPDPLPEVVTPAPGPPRLVVRPTVESPSAILRTLATDAGSRILADPALATSDWLRIRLANLAVMYEASAAVSRILDVDDLLGRIVDLVLRTTGADHGCAMLTDPETGELMPKAVRARQPAGAAPELVVSRTVIDHVLTSGEGVLVADAGADERFRRGESVTRHQIREVICAPMTGRRETVGVLFLDTRRDAPVEDPSSILSAFDPPGRTKFTDDHLTLAVAVAHQAAVAVEETRYYQAMVHAERLAAVGQTIAALSHHIKNIMQGVRFGSDMVRAGLADDDRDLLLKGWKLVEKNQGRIDDLILDMLSYSKEREPLAEPTDLSALADDVVELVRGRAEAAGVVLERVARPPLPAVPCDPDGVHRALLNVVSNAVDAVAERAGGRVTVEAGASADGAFAEVVVTDNGPGIAPDKLADVFKPFVSTKGSRGTGLGLPVSRKTLREHGGDVVATSTPGQGSRFALRIPMRCGGASGPRPSGTA